MVPTSDRSTPVVTEAERPEEAARRLIDGRA